MAEYIFEIDGALYNDETGEAVMKPEYKGKLIRCKDCKYQDKGENDVESWNLCGFRPWLYVPVTDDHFCGYAKRKDGEAE